MRRELGTILSVAVLSISIWVNAQEHAAVDYGHETFQPAYAEGRVVQFEQRGPSEEGIDAANVNTLYEVEYPAGWQTLLARPLCNFCDHGSDGENAWDYHDHVLADLPTEEANAAGEVHWYVMHVRPAYGEDEVVNADITAAYAARLPARSEREVKALLGATLTDGTPVAEAVDTQYTFTAPLIRW